MIHHISRFKMFKNKKLLPFFLMSFINTTAYSEDADDQVVLDILEDSVSTVETTNSKNSASVSKQTEYGKIEFKASVENDDFASQCQAEWKKNGKDNSSKKEGKNDQEPHSPKAKMSISWSSDDK